MKSFFFNATIEILNFTQKKTHTHTHTLKRDYSGLVESYVEPMNVGFEMGTLVLEGIKLSSAGIAGQPRRSNDSVLRVIKNNDVVCGGFKGLGLAYGVVIGNGRVWRREKASRVEEIRRNIEDGTVSFILRRRRRGGLCCSKMSSHSCQR